MSHNRPERVAGLVHAEIARILREEISDPRLQAVSVTGVWMSPDLQLARVWILPLGGEGEVREVLAAARRARSFMRRELGRRLSLRRVPELEFHADEKVDEAVRLTRLLENLEEPQEAGEE